MANDENLNPPWKPGESGNPEGNPPGCKHGITSKLDRILKTKPPDVILDRLKARKIPGIEEVDMAEAMAHVMAHKALEGDLPTIRTILERTEGAVVQKIAPVTPDGQDPYAGASAQELMDYVAEMAAKEASEKAEDDETEASA